MRIVQYRSKDRTRLSLIVDGRIIDIASAAAERGLAIAPFHSTLAVKNGPR